MTITRENLKIFKPELLGSSDDAGGQRTLNVVESGKLNELFQAISDIDHAQSALDIVKCYPAVDTPDTSTLLGAHLFISEPPTDALVSMMTVQSDALNDESRMTDMKEILESGVTAGSLIREGAPGFLPNQNSFSRDYLESRYTLNNKEYRKFTNLRVGQVICITVEYQGVENVTWPRFQHFAVVTDTNAPGNDVGNIVFDPPMPTATPEYDVVINGETNCTRLRLVNDASPLTFHGVTKLTAAADAKTLPVVNTKQNLIPVVLSEKVHSGVRLDDTGLIRKSITQVASEAQSYQFAVTDVLQGDNIKVDYDPTVNFISGGKAYGSEDAVITVGTDSVNVTLARKPDINTTITLSYASTGAYQNYNNTDAFPANRKLVQNTISGTVRQTSSGNTLTFFERDGSIYINLITGDVRAGIVDYNAGTITLESDFTNDLWVAIVANTDLNITSTSFLLNVDEPVLTTFYVQVLTVGGQTLSGSSDGSGVITGSGVSGTIVNNFVTLTFTQSVQLNTLSYDITETVRSLPPADIYGLNPIRIPNGGVVDIFKVWGTVSIQHSQYQAVTSPTVGQTFTIRANARFVDITDKDGKSLWTPNDANYTVDLAGGLVTINSDFTGFTAPFVLTDSIGELGLVTGFDDDSVTLASDLTQQYPKDASVASVQILDDLQARVGKVRDMTAWDGNWDVDGDPANGNLNTVDHPIEVDNSAAVNEDWALIFTTDTAFRCIGRRVGQVGTGDTLNDFAPINTVTNKPYFTIRKEAFGGGWSAGEAIRFATYASSKPVMAVRTVQAGHSQITTDRAVLSFRGNES